MGSMPKLMLVGTHKILSGWLSKKELIIKISLVELDIDAFTSTSGTDVGAMDLSSHSADTTLAASIRALTSGLILVRRRWICRQVTLSAQMLSPSPKGLSLSVLTQSSNVAYSVLFPVHKA